MSVGWGPYSLLVNGGSSLDILLAEPKSFPSIFLNRAERKDMGSMQALLDVRGFGPYCIWGQTKELQLSSGFGIDGCSPDSTEPMEGCAVDLRGPGFDIRYMDIDFLASTFLRFVRLSPGHPTICDDEGLWERQVFKLGCDTLDP